VQGSFDIVNVFDVLYHIVDEDKFEQAIRNLGTYCKAGGWVFISDAFNPLFGGSEHVKYRPLEKYQEVLGKYGLKIMQRYPLFYFLGKSPVGNRQYTFFSKVAARCIEMLVPATYLLDTVYCRPESATLALLACRKE
jgi:2-polyprenyl-3-methyl-5-hydroxy-6-metoxy-1,4-benzoquinol methylase